MEYIQNALSFLPREWVVFFTAMLPLFELKGAIPVGISLGLSPCASFALSYVGSSFPAPFILFFIQPLFFYIRNHTSFRKLVDKITKRNDENTKKIQRYGTIGLFFCSHSLAGIGGLERSLAAAMLNLPWRRALPVIFLGNLIAGSGDDGHPGILLYFKNAEKTGRFYCIDLF